MATATAGSRRRRFGFPLLLLAAFLPGEAAAKRIALLIGNDGYAEIEPLRKARNDALAVSKKLEALGFETLTALDADRRDMNAKLREFEARIEPGDVALLFYAGHGVEIDGENYLLPVDAPAAGAGDEGLVKDEAVALSATLDRLRRSPASLAIVFLDACRDNPFAAEGQRGAGAARGLGRITAPNGAFVMFSAASGESALDRLSNADPDPNSVYTRNLLALLDEPGLSLQDMALRIRRSVNALAATIGHSQTPAYYDETLDAFEFSPALSPEDPSAALKVQEVANDYLAAKADGGPAALRGFLNRRGEGAANPFAAVARAELEALAAAAPPGGAGGGAPAEEHMCDRLAANPSDPLRRTDGVLWDDLARTSALAACAEAIELRPADPQFRYQYARVLQATGDFARARRIFEGLAEEGYAAAINNVAVMALRGQAGPVDEAAARALFERAAALGYPPALNNLGWQRQNARGGPADLDEARRLYLAAVEAGHAVSMTNLGWMALSGLGEPVDFGKARDWFVKAAERGNAVAMTNLGWMDQNALGAPRDFAAARRWFEEAARRGDPKAMRNLGELHAKGIGLDPAPREAAHWYLRALRAGDFELLAALTERPDALPPEVWAGVAETLVAGGFHDAPAASATPESAAAALPAYVASYRR